MVNARVEKRLSEMGVEKSEVRGDQSGNRDNSMGKSAAQVNMSKAGNLNQNHNSGKKNNSDIV